jgi:hypothetical protein
MVQRVFEGLERRERIVPLPLFLLKLLYHIIACLPMLRRFQQQLNPAMLERMNQDLCFNHLAAKHHFAYQARAFYPDALSLGSQKARIKSN